MKVEFSIENGNSYYFKSVKDLREEILYLSWGIFYEGLITGIEKVYGKIEKLVVGNMRLI